MSAKHDNVVKTNSSKDWTDILLPRNFKQFVFMEKSITKFQCLECWGQIFRKFDCSFWFYFVFCCVVFWGFFVSILSLILDILINYQGRERKQVVCFIECIDVTIASFQSYCAANNAGHKCRRFAFDETIQDRNILNILYL